MTILIILALIVLGIVMLMLELAVIPGFTVFGVAAIGILGYSVYLAFINYGIWAGIGVLVALIVLLPVLFMKFFKTKAGRKMQLESVIDGKVNQIEYSKINVGDKGKALGRLAPMGKIEVNGYVAEGKSLGNYIPEGSEIEIVKISENHIIVKQII